MEIRDFLTTYQDGIVQISTHVTENQREIIEKNHQMRSGKFENRYFEDGETEKLYFNVVFGFCQALIRGSGLGLNEFTLTSLNGKWLKLVDILKMGLKHFLKYNDFEDTKGQVLTELVEMGHVLTKVVDGETTIVDLRNFVFKPNMKSAKEEGGAEKIFYSYEEAKAEYGENDNWNEVQVYYDKIKKTTNQLTFVEYWAVDEFDIDGKKQTTKGCIKYLDRSDIKPDTHQRPDDWSPYLEMDRFVSPHEVATKNKREIRIYGKTKRVFPYDEQRLIEIPGRYIGMGGYEICRPGQEDYNEKRNFKRKFDRLALRGILVHKIGSLRDDRDGEALTQEFLNRVDTGGAVKIFSDESLERLNLGSITNDTLAMTNDLFEFMRFMLGVTPIAVGNDTSNKTAYYAMTQNQTQQSTYLVIKNKTARLFERLFQDFLLDDVIDDILNNDVIAIYGDKHDLEELDQFLAQSATYSDPTITSQDEAQIQIDQSKAEQQSMGQTRYIDVSDKKVKRAFRQLLKDLDFIAEFDVADQAIDPNAKINTLIEMDKIQNPKLRAVIADTVGVSPKLIELSDEEQQAIQQSQAPQAKPPIENISYKDAPEDIKRQMEAQAGMQPSQMPAPVAQPNQTA
jgi:hypothetical protein